MKILVIPNRLLMCFLLLMFSNFASLARGENEDSAKKLPQNLPKEEATLIQINDLQKQIKRFEDSENPDVAKALNVTLEQLKERTEILQETKSFYNQQLQALHKHESLMQERQSLEEKIATGEALKLEAPPPYSLKFYDDFNIRLSENKRNHGTALLAVSVIERVLRDAKDRIKEADISIRLLKSETSEKMSQQEALQNQWLLDQAKRDEGLASAIAGYQELALVNARQEAEIGGIKANLFLQIHERIRENLHFDQADLDKQLAVIDARKKELQDNSEIIKKNLRQANRKLDMAQRKVQNTTEESDLGQARESQVVEEQWRKTFGVQLEQIENILQQLSTRKQLWKQRYDLVKHGIERKEFAGLKEEAVKQRQRFQQSLLLEQERQTSLQLKISKLEDQLEQEGLSGDAKSNLNDQRKAAVGQVGSTINFITAMNTTSQMNLRFIDELERAQHSLSLNEMAGAVMAYLKGWWKAELFVVDEQALTVSRVTMALAILIFGILLTGFLSRLVQRRILVRLKISASSTAIVGKLVHYSILTLVILFAMRTVKIPLTAFTFLGGAIAIGVGFGAQKLINNFISSFIIMAEQPIRVGDLILMDNEQCWIEDIGARCTKVRTYANTHILVPNSYFLENNITNWTHQNNMVRGEIKVGVSYGSPTRKVKDMLLKAAAEHGDVHEHPEPQVIFGDFGDNSLVFELYFWVTITQSAGIMRISSDLRFMIDEHFREAGITMSFPQRDLHFDTGKPIQIELSRFRPGQEKKTGKA